MTALSKCFFLELPLEIRCTIYRLLLNVPRRGNVRGYPSDSEDSVIEFAFADDLQHEAHPLAPLLVCRQIYAECSLILYGESVFAIECGSLYTIASFRNRRVHRLEWKRLPIKKMQRFRVIVELSQDHEMEPVCSGVKTTCKLLQGCMEVRQLDIELNVKITFEDVSKALGQRLLEPFTLLRGLRVVNFTNVPPAYV